MAEGEKVVANNRAAFHEYFILDSVEAGLELLGTEVKSLREGKVNIKDGYVRIEKRQAFLENVNIQPWVSGNRQNHEPLRSRKLLLHRAEIRELFSKIREKGLTVVPLRLYFRDGRAKVEVALVKGKKSWDKRARRSPSATRSARWTAQSSASSADADHGVIVAVAQDRKQRDSIRQAIRLLGVRRGATIEEVIAARRVQAKQWHPDVNRHRLGGADGEDQPRLRPPLRLHPPRGLHRGRRRASPRRGPPACGHGATGFRDRLHGCAPRGGRDPASPGQRAGPSRPARDRPRRGR